MKRLKWYDYININLFWLGMNIRNTAIGSIFMPYLVVAYAPEAIRNSALGFMRTAGLIIAMLAQPAFGLISDRSTSRFGRRRPFIVIGVLLDLLFLAAIAMSWNYWALMIAILLIQLSANISHGPLQGLIPDLVPEDQRGTASAIKAIMELVPLIIVGKAIPPLLENGHYAWAFIATGIGLVIPMLFTVLLIKEEPLKEKPDTPFWPPMLRVLGMLAGILLGALAGLVGGGLVGGLVGLLFWPFVGQAAALAIMVGIGGAVAMVVAVVCGVWAGTLTTLGQDARKESSFTWWIVNRLMFLAAITSIQSYAPYFLMFAFKIDRDAATSMTGNLITMVGLFTLLSAFGYILINAFWGRIITERIGQSRLSAICGALAAIAGVMLLSVIWAPRMEMINIIGAIMGLATGLFMSANWALGTELVPPAEAGRYLGVSNLAGAGAGIVGTGIGGPIADYLNSYSPGLGYFAIFAAYALLFALSIVSLAGVKKQRKVLIETVLEPANP